jgi:membrane-anchored protein YejM (alkaline phosphatase superfamily)
MKKFLILSSLFFLLILVIPKKEKSPNIFLITLDGVRWQEVFYGIDKDLVDNTNYVENKSLLIDTYYSPQLFERREKLMPFTWNYIYKNGKLFGDSLNNSNFSLTNNKIFSYPGYNEILTGNADSTIKSNAKIYNKNVTVLEKLNQTNNYKNKIAAFASWDVFPYIINDKRSGIPVNAGYMEELNIKTPIVDYINKNQKRTPVIWENVRLDVYTHNLALEYIKKKTPKLVYIAYGETDDFAHKGDYDFYINSLNYTDNMIAELWGYVQSNKFYKDNTYFIITTDHGRGLMEDWSGHGTSQASWLAILGPNIEKTGLVEGEFFTNQIAETIMQISKKSKTKIPTD